MKIRTHALWALTALLSVSVAPMAMASAPATAQPASNPSQVVAEFKDGHKITIADVQQAIASLPPQLRNAPFSKIFEALQSRLVDMKILMDAAKKEGFDKKADVLKRIEESQEAVVQKAELDRLIALELTAEVKRKKYDELVATLDKNEHEIRLRQITFKDEAQAKKALEEVKSGKKTFDQALEAHGSEENKKVKGDIGYVRRGDMPKDMWEVLSNADKGKVVPAVQKTGDLYLVCLVDDKRVVQPPKFEEVEEDITKAMAPEFAVKVIEKLRKEANIKKIGLDGKPIVDKPADAKDGKDKEKKEEEKPAIDLSKVDMNMVVAELPSGEKITAQNVRDTQATLPPQLREAPFDKVFELLVNRVVDMKIISAAARKSNQDKDPKVLKRREEVRDLIIQKAYLDNMLEEYFKKNPDEIKKRYEEIKKILPKDEQEVRLRMILMKDEAKAKDVLKEIKTGKTKFDDAVKTHSVDPQTRENGGDVGYLRKEGMPEALIGVVFKAPKATMLPDVIKLGEIGFAIVRVEDKRAVEPPSLEELRANIMRELSAKVAMSHLSDLRKASGVNMFDMDGKPVDLEKLEKQPIKAA
jgi:peptidyl-prolyl cis-trans isomerase C